MSELENLATARAAPTQSSHNLDSPKCSGDPRGRQAELCQAERLDSPKCSGDPRGRQAELCQAERLDSPKCSGDPRGRQAELRQSELQGKRILVTRAREQAGALSERLQAVGAIPVEFPVIRIVPPQNWEPLDSALGKLFLADAALQGDGQGHPYYVWLIFTSANGVNIFCERLLSLGFHTQNMSGVRVAAIGPATAAALARYGITADLVPGEYVAESVAAAIIKDAQRLGEALEGKRILLPRAAEARQVLVTELQQAGATVDEVAAYTTGAAASDDEQGREVLYFLQNGEIDIITFTSSSTVRNFMQWLTNCDAGELLTRNPQLKIACIGPITSQTARELGLKVDIEAREFTIDGLVEAIVQSEG